MVGITAALQFPHIQTKASNFLANYLSDRLGMDIEIGYVNIYWFSHVYLEKVLVKDTQKDTLIAINKARLNFNVNSLIQGRNLTLDKAVLNGADVRVLRNAPGNTFNINLFFNGIKELTKSDLPDSLKGIFLIKNFEISNSTFTFSDQTKDSIVNKFNYNQFRLNNIQASGENISAQGKNFQLQVNELNCVDSATSVSVKQLSGFYQITKKSMVFRTFDLNVGNSQIEASMVFQFDSIQSMKDFNENVKIICDVKKSKIYSRDLGYFATTFNKYRQNYYVDGFFSGKINRFDVKNFNLSFGSLSKIRGSVNMSGLPDFSNTFIDLKIENSLLNPQDLLQYLGEETIVSLEKFGQSSFNGRFIGFPIDFVADAVFITQIGSVDGDINFKLDQTDNLPNYSGHLVAKGLDMGVVLGNGEKYQTLDLNGRIEGKGLYESDADFYLDAVIENFGVLGYDYKNIVMDGRLSSQIFNGFISINDPNLIFEMNGSIDLGKDQESINITASLDTAILDKLNITSTPASISTDIRIDLIGLDINTLNGYVFAPKSVINYDGRSATIENFKLITENNDSLNFLEVSSNNIDCHISGKYELTRIIQDIPDIVKEYKMILKNDSATISNYYAQIDKSDSSSYYIDYNFSLFDISPFLQVFEPDIYVSKNTFMGGYIYVDTLTKVSVEAQLDTFQYNTVNFINNRLKLLTIKLTDSLDVYADLEIISEKQNTENGSETNNLWLKSNWLSNHIDLNINLDQIDKGNQINIKSVVDFGNNFTTIKFLPSNILLLDEAWSLSVENEIRLGMGEILFSDFSLSNRDQLIDIKGTISDDSSKSLNLNVRDFEIAFINPILPRDFHGVLNGYISMNGVYDNLVVNSDVTVEDLVFERFPTGNLYASSYWDVDEQKMALNFKVFNEENVNVINVNGHYYPNEDVNQLNLLASFNKANINVIEPFYENLISDLEGKTKGNFTITGNLNKPVIKGEGYVDQGRITIDYLKTSYNFEGNVRFTENEISVQNLQMIDKFNNTAILNGGILHNYFKQVQFDLKGEFEKFLALNTTINDNNSYYGTAFGTGNMHITGQEKNINIEVNAITNNGTKFYIPLSGSSEINQENFIQFRKLDDMATEDEEIEREVLKLQGIKLDFDLEVTPEAYSEIIFDQKAGDIIRGRGNGKLSLTVDTQGEFNMFGNYEFESGGYNFTLYNVINKEFSIEPNSNILWTGDPYGARLDLEAKYEQTASLAPLLTGQDSSFYDQPEVKRKYPTTVILYLKGPLLSPDINFDIDIYDYPTSIVGFETSVASFKSEIKANEQELKRQVFSLIILRKFAEQGSFSVGNSFGNSVSEFISNQLSYWITQIDENLEIDFDLGTLDQNAFNTFQYRLSYSFNEGRLRVTRSGNITEEDAPNDVSNIIGDWELEYLLTEDGKYRAKMYNRFNYNNLYRNNQGVTTATTGFSLTHTQNFNDFRELFRSKKKKKKKSEEYTEIDEGILPSGKDSEKDEDSSTTMKK